MLKDILFALWFFLPAGLANATPIFVAKMPGLTRLNAPIDCGYSYRGRRIFGSHKTWRGLVSGIVAATLVLFLQQLAVRHFGWAQHLTDVVDYQHLPTFVMGPLFALGALGGDAIESFFKRQRDTPPGQGWFPFDQIDYIVGGAVATMPFVRLSVLQYIWLVFIWLATHLIASYIGFLLHLKERPI
jgi:CDP-2,3-bis-(O-geranylgeranyl)-sn-glycerol synthase